MSTLQALCKLYSEYQECGDDDPRKVELLNAYERASESLFASSANDGQRGLEVPRNLVHSRCAGAYPGGATGQAVAGAVFYAAASKQPLFMEERNSRFEALAAKSGHGAVPRRLGAARRGPRKAALDHVKRLLVGGVGETG